MAALVRCLWLSSGMNDFLCLVIGIPNKIFFTSGLIYQLANNLIYLLLAERIQTMKETLELDNWEEVSGDEKLMIITTFFFIIVTFLTLLYLCYWVTKKCEFEAE